jgi:hypothetical protein
VRLRASEAPTTDFRGFTLSLVVFQPATVDGLISAAVDAGATPLKPAAKLLWGYGAGMKGPWLLERFGRWLNRGTRKVPWDDVRLSR